MNEAAVSTESAPGPAASPNAAPGSATTADAAAGIPRASDTPPPFGITAHPGIDGDEAVAPEPETAAAADPAQDPAAAAAATSQPGMVEITVRGEKRSYTPEKAAHLVQTLVGQYKAREGREQQAAATANAWQSTAENLRRENEQLKAQLSTGAAAAAATSTAPATSAPANGKPAATTAVDWDLITAVANHPDGGPLVAMHELHNQMASLAEAREKQLEANLRKELSAEYQPLLQDRQSNESLRELSNLVQNLSTAIDPRTGAIAYPELSDPAAIESIGKALDDLAPHLKPESLSTPWGLHQAVLLHRYRAGTGAATPAPSTVAPVAAPAAPPTDAALVAALSGTEPPLTRPPATVPAAGSSFAAAIKNAGRGDDLFGVKPYVN